MSPAARAKKRFAKYRTKNFLVLRNTFMRNTFLSLERKSAEKELTDKKWRSKCRLLWLFVLLNVIYKLSNDKFI